MITYAGPLAEWMPGIAWLGWLLSFIGIGFAIGLLGHSRSRKRIAIYAGMYLAIANFVWGLIYVAALLED
ncbi:hypothetical protein [Rubripirellula reticaptiva]|uniref:hypothetical protein n=1 Tax=Rubripirellula reticaptiva TaxID=2528013 RepID=UPI0011B63B29|nr:hypothetical protein [Rubripirellula reticaptiva]